MSASSPMCRSAILLLVLATSLVAFAYDSPAPVARPHSKTADMRMSRERSRTRHTASSRRHTGRKSSRAAGHSLRVGSRVGSRAASHLTSAHLTSAREARRGAHSRIAAERALALRRRNAEREEIRREEARELKARRARMEQAAIRETTRQTARADSNSEQTASLSRQRTEDDPAPAGEPHSDSEVEENVTRAPAATSDTPAADQASQPTSSLDLANLPGSEDLHQLSVEASLSVAHGEMPPPLRGSLALLERQDERLDADGLERIEDEDDLAARIDRHMLVPLPVSDALTVNDKLPQQYRYCRPWTARFLTDLARAHDAVFHQPLEVSSAVRTVVYQEHLMRINGNAAPAEGDLVSPHLMGATIDIAKKQMSMREIAWMRTHLLALELVGKIDVEEEFEQACFHITVYRSYLPAQPHLPPPVRRARRTHLPAASVAEAIPSSR